MMLCTSGKETNKYFLIVLVTLYALQYIEARRQLTYNYTGDVRVTNKASDDGVATWIIFGDLTVQQLDDHHIFKLDNLRTTIFNGIRGSTIPEEKEPLVNTDYITSPFAVYYNSIDDVQLTIGKNEPVWSANMKRAIASVFHVDISVEDGFKSVEQTIFGNCGVKYNIEQQTDVTSKRIIKSIDRNNCTKVPISTKNNVKNLIFKNHTIIQFYNRRYYSFEPNTDYFKDIYTTSALTYQNMRTVRSTHHVQQIQAFILTDTIEQFVPLKISAETKKNSILWDKSKDIQEITISQTEILKEYKNAVKDFRHDFERRPLKNKDIRSVNKIDNMYSALSMLDVKEMLLLGNEYVVSGDQEDQHILISLLSYIGTDSSTALIKEFLKNDEINDLLLIKLLTTFPIYVKEPSQEKLENFKFLLNLEVTNKQVKYAGLLSFATLISDTFERGDINRKFLNDIIQIYYRGLITSDEYEEQLTYVLGLINMATCMKQDLIISIITNLTINDHLRTLATFGFKYHLTYPRQNVFEQIWPVVQNVYENFEVRVAALDLLLSSNLNEEQFNTIVNTYDRTPQNPYDEHLSNYVFTSLQSMENLTDFCTYLGDFATARLQQGNIRRNTRFWTTGNYHLAWSDDQAKYGASLQTRLIGTPVTNAFNIIHLSYQRFEMSVILETYKVYLKLGGVLDTVFLEAVMQARTDNENPIQSLVDLIKKCGYILKRGDNIHLDLAVFSNEQAVFGIHLSKENIDTYSDNLLFLDLLKLLVYYQSISFPLINNFKIPSDLGTVIEISDEMKQVTYHETENFEQLFDDDVKVKELTYRYKSSSAFSSITNAFNPLIRASATVYKYQSDETALEFPFKINNNSFVSWIVKNDTFNWACDRLIGTYVDEENVLKHFCLKCNQFYEVPVGIPSTSEMPMPILGMKFEATKTNKSQEQIKLLEMDPPRNGQIEQVSEVHRVNAFAFPPAKPFMLLWHYFVNKNLNKDLDRTLLRTILAYNEEYESILKFDYAGTTLIRDNDPFDSTEFNAMVSLINQKPNGDILSALNGTLKTTTTTKSTNQTSKPHVEHNFAFYLNISHDNINNKICINRELLYPNKRSDKLSLKPIKPAIGNITFAWGEVEDFNECPDTYFRFTEIYTATDVQNRRAEEMPEYKKCQEDSVGLKYVPPTRECVAAHESLSNYDVYGLHADFEHANKYWKRMVPFMDQTKYGYLVYEYNHLDNGFVNITVSEEIRARMLPIPGSNYQENSEFHFLTSDPTAVAYDDYDINVGLSSTCVITPNTIQTFTGVREIAFQQQPQEEIVAFVECINKTRAGLTVQRINNKTVGFQMWSGSNVLTASVQNGQMRVDLNGVGISQTPEIQDETLKIYFLEDDVIYVVDSIVEVYYTTEYISIKAPSVYNRYICGKCSYSNQ